MSCTRATVTPVVVHGKAIEKRKTSTLENGIESKNSGGAGQAKRQDKKENSSQFFKGHKGPEYKKGTTTKSTKKATTHSSVLMERRNGCAHEPVFLRVSPLSPDAEEPLVLSSSPQGDRFLSSERAISPGDQGRRETVCQETDGFAKERVAVRVMMKKFEHCGTLEG